MTTWDCPDCGASRDIGVKMTQTYLIVDAEGYELLTVHATYTEAKRLARAKAAARHAAVWLSEEDDPEMSRGERIPARRIARGV